MLRAARLIRKSPIRATSAKARKQQPARRRCLAAVKARSGGWCEYPGCRRQGVHGHEVLRRSQGGSPTDPGNVLWLCFDHHREVHDRPAEAVAAGLLTFRAKNPSPKGQNDAYA